MISAPGIIIIVVVAGNITAKSSQWKKDDSLRDEDDDDDDDDDEEEYVDSEDTEGAASNSEDEPAIDGDKSDSDDGDDSDDDDDTKPPLKSTSAAKAAVGPAADSRKRRLQELEDFVKSTSAGNVKGILKGSTLSSASSTKLVTFAADKTTNSDSDSHPSVPIYREDIYGRLRDEHGNVVNPDEVGVASGQVGAYVPPAKRQKLPEESGSRDIDKSTSESKQRVEMLTRQVKGQINRSVFTS